MTALFLVRHAETTDNELGIVSGVSRDVGLSENGKFQCKQLRRQLEKESFDRVISSPFRRAKETCLLTGFSPTCIEEIFEVREKSFGVYEGRAVLDYEDSVKSLTMEALYNYRLDGGESFFDLHQRVKEFLRGFLHFEKRTIVFSHECFIRCAVAHVKGMPFDRWLEIPQRNAGIVEIPFSAIAVQYS